VSRGYTADADPQAWKIVDGKLYLNYNKGVQQKWETDVPRCPALTRIIAQLDSVSATFLGFHRRLQVKDYNLY
jgi:hypothetical protein